MSITDFSRTEGIPHYVRIRESLREMIAAGELERGQKLPSEDELATRYGVSRMTVRQGLSDLIDDGLLYRRRGVGTYVALPHVERDHTRLTDFFENSNIKGIQTKASILNIEVNPVKPKIAKALSLEKSELIIHIKSIRFADDVPVTLHDAYIPHKLFAELIKDDLNSLDIQHLWSLFENLGVRVKNAVQRVEARGADQEIARLMQTEVGAPILYKERTVFADDGTPVEFTYCYNRGDMYSLTVTLNR
jgi:GntR family transcriptional regulator